MKPSLLLALVCTAVLAVGARAYTSEEPEPLLEKVREYAQKATAMVKNALTTVKESEVALHARQWLADNTDLAKQKLSWLREQLVELWKKKEAA
ncbi:apolipoprotein C-III [Colius striatus]|uniref:apolipoprotein C-III n=1 Tax=Colius striatus TaxID=57412 RepID=UPI002B1D869D|nr:apolipoprotein C-III [Colius striatus]XP_061870096.1 apolipoprotein C-III [Colius striatus]